MAEYKLRRKKGPVETEAREVSRGKWQFETTDFYWQWTEVLGINLILLEKLPLLPGLERTSRSYFGMLHAKTLNQAIMFAQGFQSGWTQQLKGLGNWRS